MNNDFEKLVNGKWGNKYFTKLAMLDHIRECLEKDNYLKATDTPKTDVGYENLDKELMDLSIILELYFRESPELRERRLKKFIENLEK